MHKFGWSPVISKNDLKVVVGISILFTTVATLVLSFKLWEEKGKHNASLHEIRYELKKKMIFFSLRRFAYYLDSYSGSFSSLGLKF